MRGRDGQGVERVSSMPASLATILAIPALVALASCLVAARASSERGAQNSEKAIDEAELMMISFGCISLI